MQIITTCVQRILLIQRCRKGSTGIEYATIAALVSVVFITAMAALGQNIDATYSHVATALVAPALDGAPDTPTDEGGGQ
jgi:Flp pilus assembly pilin Flp